mmetsp:Transcript_86891/g.119722  ORF Transcript_86891/g.119722 Transcript_86891/m.119722 type:complete len:102 (-) Transcript_86891:327-632(-)
MAERVFVKMQVLPTPMLGHGHYGSRTAPMKFTSCKQAVLSCHFNGNLEQLTVRQTALYGSHSATLGAGSETEYAAVSSGTLPGKICPTTVTHTRGDGSCGQ